MTDTFEVARSATIPAPPERVYEEITDFRRWQQWSPWEGMDPQMQRNYRGAENGPGAVYEWQGNRKVGQGRMEITEADAPSRVVIALEFIKPWKAKNTTTFALMPEGDGTRVTWSMVGPRTLVMKVMGVLMNMDKRIGADFDRGLAQLKATVAG